MPGWMHLRAYLARRFQHEFRRTIDAGSTAAQQQEARVSARVYSDLIAFVDREPKEA